MGDKTHTFEGTNGLHHLVASLKESQSTYLMFDNLHEYTTSVSSAEWVPARVHLHPVTLSPETIYCSRN